MDAMSKTIAINPLAVWDEILTRQPEVIAITGVPQEVEWHPEGPVDIHTRMTIEAAVAITNDMPEDERAVIFWGAACHDLGKATTTEIKAGRVVSPKHPAAGEAPTRNMLTRLGVDPEIIEKVVDGVREHMAHLNGVDERQIKRLMARMTLSVPGLGFVIIADHSARPWTGEVVVPDLVSKMWTTWSIVKAKAEAEAARPKPLLTGQDLVDAGMQPGPAIGAALKRVAEAQAAGEVKSREEAMNMAMRAS